MFCNNNNHYGLLFALSVLWLYCYYLTPTSAAVTASQRAEIAKLRGELNAAFEKHEEQQLDEAASQGDAIVQPSWTRNKASAGTQKPQSKVIVNSQVLSEAEALRAEINKAIAQDVYAAGVGDLGSTQQVHELEKELHKKGSTQTLPKVGSEKEILGAQLDDGEEAMIAGGPNIAEANDALYELDTIDVRKLQRLELSKRRTREMLVLTRVIEDFNFNLGDDVQQWTHVVHNNSVYYIGKRAGDLLVVQQEHAKYVPIYTLPVEHPIAYLEVFRYWNSLHELQEGVVLVALQDEIRWYRYSVDGHQYTNDWQWHVGTIVTGLTYFTIDERQYLVVSTNQSARAGYYALNVYQFDLEAKEFWIVQRLQMDDPCIEVTVLDTGRDLILAVPQVNTAVIYMFNVREAANPAHLHFEQRHTIKSEYIAHIASFQMGGRSYLALGGLQPQIMLYEQGALKPKTMLGHNFGLVELFLPIPVRTYRDDLILLVQHRVDFSTHTLIVLETLIWNGEAFETSIPVPCKLGEHIAYGVSCMLDVQRDAGIRGAALLHHGDQPLLVVPRHRAESGMFHLQTQLLAKNSELLDLQEIWAFLQDWVQEQDTLIAQAESYLKATDMPANTNDFDYERISTPELIFDGELGDLYINDYKWTQADTDIDLHNVLADIRQLEQELKAENLRQRRDLNLFDYKYEYLDADLVEAQELWVENVNGVPFYIKNGSLIFDGTLNLRGGLTVHDTVYTRQPRQAVMLHMRIDDNEDLLVARINGLDWHDIRQKLVFRNQPLELEQLIVEGEVIAEQNVTLDTLNGLSFPDDYLWSNGGVTASIVQAAKTFTGKLSANAVDTDGVINGVNPMDAITLSDAQDWPGFPVFTTLEVSEALELNGTAQGRNFEAAPVNPTLLESHQLAANCDFRHLEVNGPLILRAGKFNQQPFSKHLADIVQRPLDAADVIQIDASKQFNDVTLPNDFHVSDNAVSGIPLHDFISLHSTQTLTNLTQIRGYVYFHDLQLTGKYDGVDIAALQAQSLRIDVPQTAAASTTQLHFEHAIIDAAEIAVLTRLNGISLADGYQRLNEDLHVAMAQFQQLDAQVAEIHGNIVGRGQLNALNLTEFLMQRTWQTPQAAGNIYVDDLELSHGLFTDKLHGINASLLLGFLQQIDELPQMVLNGQIQMASMHITGAVHLNGALNGVHFEDALKPQVIWLNRENYLSNRFNFVDAPQLAGNLNVLGSYNGLNMPDFVDDIVFRPTDGNQTLLIRAPKRLTGNVLVRGETRVVALNGVPFEFYANKANFNEFQGDVQIQGKLYAHSLDVQGLLNGYDVQALGSMLKYVPQLGAFVQRGRVELAAQQALHDLTVYGRLGDETISKRPIHDFFADLIYKEAQQQPLGRLLRGTKIFSGRVTIAGAAHIGKLNAFNLTALLDNIVYIDRPATIRSAVVFTAPVSMLAATLHVHGALHTTQLNGCELDEWLRETVRVDQRFEFERTLSFAAGTLDNNALYASFWNDVDLSKLITLQTAQNLSMPLVIDELRLDGHIQVASGAVNNVNLSEEYANTLLQNAGHPQVVSTPLLLKSLHVLGNLSTLTPIVDDKELRDVATLHMQQTQVLETPLYFKQLTARNVRTLHGAHITGIDFNEWYANSLWYRERAEQRITGSWRVRNLYLKTLNGMQQNRIRRKTQLSSEARTAVCQQLRTLQQQVRRRGIVIKHLELHSVLDMNRTECSSQEQQIVRTFVLSTRAAGQHCLLLNTGCWSQLQQWNAAAQRFAFINCFESGPVDEVVQLHNSEELQFWTKYEGLLDEHNCTLEAANIASGRQQSWHMSQQHDIIVEPLAAADALLDAQPAVESNRTVYSTRMHTERAIKYLPRPTTTFFLKRHHQTVNRSHFSFVEFRIIVLRVLDDLSFRLNAEMDITQLSIPESDLYDEHLVEDFLAIMQELRDQRHFPDDHFAEIKVDALQIPSNPAQVLAARAVQILWPSLVDIEELYSYLPAHEAHGQRTSSRIKAGIGELARDVLMLAYSTPSQSDTATMEAVIARIRAFLHEMSNVSLKLEFDDAVDDDFKLHDDETLQLSATSNVEEIVKAPLLAGGAHLRLLVGAADKPRLLYAHINGAPTLSPKTPPLRFDAVHVHQSVDGSLFQILETVAPARELATLRIRDETLLAFVEDCCRLRVFIYRGVQGFIPFADFELKQPIVQLLALRLPVDGVSRTLYSFAAVHANQISFYEIVTVGELNVPNVNLDC